MVRLDFDGRPALIGDQFIGKKTPARTGYSIGPEPTRQEMHTSNSDSKNDKYRRILHDQ
jgi:hypothetical protein